MLHTNIAFSTIGLQTARHNIEECKGNKLRNNNITTNNNNKINNNKHQL